MKTIIRYAIALLLGTLLADCSAIDLPIMPATPTIHVPRTTPTLSSNAIQIPLAISTPTPRVPSALDSVLGAPPAPTRVPLVPPVPGTNRDRSTRAFDDRPPK